MSLSALHFCIMVVAGYGWQDTCSVVIGARAPSLGVHPLYVRRTRGRVPSAYPRFPHTSAWGSEGDYVQHTKSDDREWRYLGPADAYLIRVGAPPSDRFVVA